MDPATGGLAHLNTVACLSWDHIFGMSLARERSDKILLSVVNGRCPEVKCDLSGRHSLVAQGLPSEVHNDLSRVLMGREPKRTICEEQAVPFRVSMALKGFELSWVFEAQLCS